MCVLLSTEDTFLFHGLLYTWDLPKQVSLNVFGRPWNIENPYLFGGEGVISRNPPLSSD